MTRIPTESRDFEGLKGDEYPDFKVGPVCSVPGCARLCDHAHHIIRRSALAGAYSWVRMPDGVEIGNLTGMCFAHHQDITENKERIEYRGGKFYWTDGKPLTRQPPVREIIQTTEQEIVRHTHDDKVSIDVRQKCDACGRALPKPKIDGQDEEKRPRATWAVSVPMDQRENGAETLSELLEAAREEMAKKGWEYGDASTAKFFVLSHVLATFVLHADQILSDE